MNLVIIALSCMVLHVGGEVISNYDDYDNEDLDSIIEYLYDSNVFDNARRNRTEDVNKEEQPTFSNGSWKCGDCSSVDESQLLYGESLELGANYNAFGNIETQIGFVLNNMKCISIEAEEHNVIRRLSGSCMGDEVVLGIRDAFDTHIRIY